MKNVLLTLLTAFIALLHQDNLRSQVVLEDFEGGSELTWIAQDGQYYANIKNEFPDAENMSPQVGGYTKAATTGFSLFYTILPTPLQIQPGGTITIQFRTPVRTGVLLKLESTGPSPNQFEVSNSFTVTQQWVTYTFDVGGASSFNDLDQLILFFDPGQNSGDTYLFDNIILNNITLPVEWGDVRSQTIDNDILVEWETLRELNTESFEIEHSTDGRNYKKIHATNAQFRSTESNQYRYVMRNAEPGQHFFRIKQIDIDGQYSYSKVISSSVNFKAASLKNSIVSDRIEVDIDKDKAYGIYSVNGRLMSRGLVISDLPFIDTSSLPAGQYYLKLENDVEAFSFIKH